MSLTPRYWWRSRCKVWCQALTPRYWWRIWCKVWWAWHLDIDDESHVEFENLTPRIDDEWCRLSNLTPRYQWRGVVWRAWYLDMIKSLKSLTPRYWWRKWCKVLKSLTPRYWWRTSMYQVWWTWHLDIDDESRCRVWNLHTSILNTKVM